MRRWVCLHFRHKAGIAVCRLLQDNNIATHTFQRLRCVWAISARAGVSGRLLATTRVVCSHNAWWWWREEGGRHCGFILIIRVTFVSDTRGFYDTLLLKSRASFRV